MTLLKFTFLTDLKKQSHCCSFFTCVVVLIILDRSSNFITSAVIDGELLDAVVVVRDAFVCEH